MTLLTEVSTNKAIQHLEHLEDLVINNGREGAALISDILQELIQIILGISSDGSISIKIDGSPALVFGIDPRKNVKEYGTFFIGTKSAFNKTEPKLAHSKKEISILYSKSPAAVQAILLECFDPLKKIIKDGIYQADFLFGPNDKRRYEIDGQKYIVFTPNTITYAIPVDKKSNLYNKVNAAKIGLVIHTRYRCIDENSTQLIVSPINLGDINDIESSASSVKAFIITPSVDSQIIRDTIDVSFLEMAQKELKSRAIKIPGVIDKIWDAKVKAEAKKFINKLIRQGPSQIRSIISTNDATTLTELFFEYLRSPDKIRGFGKYENRIEYVNSVLVPQTTAVARLFDIFLVALHIKERVLEQLQHLGNVLGKHFIMKGDGFEATGPEGFVLTTDKGIIKFVDRLNFSRFNFLMGVGESMNVTIDTILSEAGISINRVSRRIGNKTAAVVLGRFSVLTKAHLELFKDASRYPVDLVVICIVMGKKSSRDKDKNPTTFQLRKEMIDAAFLFPHKVIKADTGFIGDFINTLRNLNIEPKYLIVGPDRAKGMQAQVDRYSDELNLDLTVVPAGTKVGQDVRATFARLAIRNGDKKEFMRITPRSIWSFWDKLRKIV